jgi:hypothetical protein
MKYCQPWCSAERTILKRSFGICTLVVSYALFNWSGTQWRCFTTNPIELVSHRQTVVGGIHCQNCLINKIWDYPLLSHLDVRSASRFPEALCDNRVGNCIWTEDCR